MMLQKHISISISRAICISLLLLAQVAVMAQRHKANVIQPKDTLSFFRHVAVSGDLVGLVQMQFSDYGQYEVAARVSLRNRYFPVVELGYGKADSEDPSTHLHYTSKAPYGRIGVDFNMMKNKNDDYRLYVGVRYGYSKFKYSVTHPGLNDPVWKTQIPFDLTDIDNQFHWMEWVVGVDAKIWGPFRLGWSVRYKRRLANTKNEAGHPWYVPGFGKYSGTPLGGTFNVIIEW